MEDVDEIAPDRYYIDGAFIFSQMCDHLYFIISKRADDHRSHAECNGLQTHILSGVADFHLVERSLVRLLEEIGNSSICQFKAVRLVPVVGR